MKVSELPSVTVMEIGQLLFVSKLNSWAVFNLSHTIEKLVVSSTS